MTLTKLACWKRSEQGKAVIVEADRVKLEISHTDLARYHSEKKIKEELLRQAQLNNVKLPDIFIHINRDGSIAMATGATPDEWPEGEEKKR